MYLFSVVEEHEHCDGQNKHCDGSDWPCWFDYAEYCQTSGNYGQDYWCAICHFVLSLVVPPARQVTYSAAW